MELGSIWVVLVQSWKLENYHRFAYDLQQQNWYTERLTNINWFALIFFAETEKF